MLDECLIERSRPSRRSQQTIQLEFVHWKIHKKKNSARTLTRTLSKNQMGNAWPMQV